MNVHVHVLVLTAAADTDANKHNLKQKTFLQCSDAITCRSLEKMEDTSRVYSGGC